MKTLEQAIEEDDVEFVINIINVLEKSYINMDRIFLKAFNNNKINIVKFLAKKNYYFLNADEVVKAEFEIFKYILKIANLSFTQITALIDLANSYKFFDKYTYLLSLKKKLIHSDKLGCILITPP